MTASPSPLSPVETATLQALADACNYSLSAHVPKEAITRRAHPNLRGDVKKSLKKLRSKGYCFEHPTGGNMTWQLTQRGLTMARNILTGA